MAFLTRVVNAVSDFGTLCHQPSGQDVANLKKAHAHFWNNRPNAGMRAFHTLTKETADLVYLQAAKTEHVNSNRGRQVFGQLSSQQKASLLKRVIPVEITWTDWKEGWGEWKNELRAWGDALAQVKHESSADADPIGSPSCADCSAPSSDADPAGSFI